MEKKSEQKGKPFVYIAWGDATSAPDKWMYLDDLPHWAEHSSFVVHHVGWIVKETEDYIVIAAMRVEGSEWNQAMFGHVHKIPKGWIIQRKEFFV